MKELLSILLVSLVLLTIFVAIKVYRAKMKANAMVLCHFRFEELFWDAPKNAWQLKLELFKKETLLVKALDENKECYYEQTFDLPSGTLIIGLDSIEFKKAASVEVISSDKSYFKVLK
tara:strand:+ start:22513 stop:22866 length:354 start_codon:yes stop_codon:yes gene_type:complete